MRNYYYSITGLLLFLLGLSFSSYGSIPEVVNYTTKDYNSHSINYCFAQDSVGMIYVGNAYCVLEFDGKSWRKIPLVDGKSALSMASDPKGNIFVTSSSEFGYLTKDSSQQTVYKSLKEYFPEEDKDEGELLDLTFYNGAFYFRSLYNIFKYEKIDGKHTIERIPGTHDKHIVTNLQIYEGIIAYHEQDFGRGILKHGKAVIVDSSAKWAHIQEVAQLGDNFFQYGQSSVFDTKGLAGNLGKTMKDYHITSAVKLDETHMVIGTFFKGIFIVNDKGEIERNLNTSHGLQDNYIRGLFRDDAGNIWIAYNNGVGLLKLNFPIEYISSAQKVDGLGYCGVVFENRLYLGTSQGIYFLEDWRNGLRYIKSFTKLEGPSGTINDFKVQNGRLLACQHAEVYEVIPLKSGEKLTGHKVKRLSNGHWYGAWVWEKDHFDHNKAYVGTYEGVCNYRFENGEWKFKNKIKGFKESSRVLQVDKRGIIWVVQGNKGLYRVEVNQSGDSAIKVNNYSELYGFKPDNFNDIFRFNDKIYVTSITEGVYTLNNDSLVVETSFSEVKDEVIRARKFNGNGLYSIYKNRPYILELKGNKWAIKNTPVSFLNSNLVGSAEFFREIASDIYLVGIENGFAIYRPFEEVEAKKRKGVIRKVEILNEKGDSLLFNGTPNRDIVLNSNANNVRFTFSIPAYAEITQIVFQTQLIKEGEKSDLWQAVNEVNFKEYTNIREGKYSFNVRALVGDKVMGTTSVKFTVLPPWYRTTMAYVFYGLLVVIGAMIVRRRFIRQKLALEKEKERELSIADKLHKAEKLEIELKNKENELAYMALTYTQKKELLNSLKGKLDALSKEVNSDDRSKLNSLKRSISSTDDDESNWENFQLHFDQKNDNFFQKLKERDSKLNESYLLFCSYVRMGKSNKEIAELLNISVAAVEKRKYRLKKKWELPDEESFTDYLKNL